MAVLTITDGLGAEITLTPLFDDQVVAVVAEGHPWTGGRMWNPARSDHRS